ncbi:flagellar biosynthetic protein FliO [Thermoanaerobacterium sp. RBIITD]|uniref:flagellar biosynthetic protein FliO n=1 Tax=Thermoanaerobacterium sp. RBIITD TaxID=1550240 RepID=UPI000BB77256|nr:flagellar biosynthetic protein FliO [Thermoanaerobacterium sp. RBIITD]SNX55506.1 flagellar protein FliO/FliZ [Thermoanaerobacterium sp. RBIITD]
MSSTYTIFQVISSILIFIFVVFLAYYITIFLNKKTINITKSNNFDVIDHLYLGRDKNLYIVRVCKEFILLSVTNNSINYIKTLDSDDIVMNNKKIDYKLNFNISLDNIKNLSKMFLGGNKRDQDNEN